MVMMMILGWSFYSPNKLPLRSGCLSCHKKNKINKITMLQKTSHIAVVGGGLAGLSAAIHLIDKGYQVSIYESRKVLGGKVASWVDKNGNHIEMGLHVFFGCYYELFGLMSKLGMLDNLLLKEHVHQYVNKGGKISGLDFRWGSIGAPWNGIKAFLTTQQLDIVEKLRNAWVLATSPVVRGWIDYDGAMREIRALDKYSFAQWFLSHGGSTHSLERLWNPIAYALGFIDCHQISARCMLTIFLLFATRSEASVLRMLKGSPAEYLTHPMAAYLQQRNAEIFLRKKVRRLIYQTVQDKLQVIGMEIAKEARGNAPGKIIHADGVN
ncbi:zeta-carotene desaturase [Galdieria sulphuraria]|uniref:Zeta-carotene desaturase n=1 Tax=Galdieria sulphuraria TaxID=130081 RepID=M2WZ75_GALSU|nr:zeta-carotene desaturase [Galdieria sulphuraria]EME29365.1 zeta-carotene desaturase [Galdieria sulphuraria]|eukprot:XP_005705885.1 zeta-carotene desaturase [Galdieria sulphuraria]